MSVAALHALGSTLASAIGSTLAPALGSTLASTLGSTLASALSAVNAETSAPVTNWPARIAFTALTFAAVGLALLGMRRGWRRRGERQAYLGPLPVVPAERGELHAHGAGKYHGSTIAGLWLDRVVVHGLGVPSRVEVSVHGAGVLLERPGATTLWIPVAWLRAARLDRGIAGEVLEQAGIVVLTWALPPAPETDARLGTDTLLDTGFRLDTAFDQSLVFEWTRALLISDSAPEKEDVA